MSHKLGFSTMPILFNGNRLDPETLKPAFRVRGDAASADDKKKCEAEITEFDHYYLTYVKKLDRVNAVTVGYTFSH